VGNARNRCLFPALSVWFLVGSGFLQAGSLAEVEWDVPMPQENILSSYAPEKVAGSLNFYGYGPDKSRKIAQTFSIEAETESVAVEALVLRLGRSLPSGNHRYEVRIDFHEVYSPTASNLDPTLKPAVASVSANLDAEAGEGEAGEYFKIVFGEPITLKTYPGYPAAYAFVIRFTDYSANQQLLLAYGENIPGHRLMENTDGKGWLYTGRNPSLFYFLLGKRQSI